MDGSFASASAGAERLLGADRTIVDQCEAGLFKKIVDPVSRLAQAGA